MQITVTQDTNCTELYHLSILFQSLAKARGFEIPISDQNNNAECRARRTPVSELTVELNMDTSAATAAIDTLAAHAASKGVDVVELPPVTVSVVTPGEPMIDTVGVVLPPVSDNDAPTSHIDVNGLPWDARIHAGSRERNTDGSWRVRRRPKGVEEADWDATLARVTAELTDLMSIPVSPSAVADAAAETAEIESGPFYWVHPESSCAGIVQTREELNELLGEPLVSEVDQSEYDTAIASGYARANSPDVSQSLTDAEVDAFVDIVQGVTEPVVVAPPVTISPPVVVPPVTAVAPPITVDKPAIETFPQVMVWLTAHTPKDEAAKPVMVDKVNQILTDNGLTVLQQLNQRPDLIPQIMVQFREAFGE